jgi:cysteine desulfurase
MIYLDHNATTYIHPGVVKKMKDLMFWPSNPSSVHAYGRKAKSYLEEARKNIASLVGIAGCFKDYQIIFTASGTEANNLMLSNFSDGEIFISNVEHPSIFSHYKIAKNVKLIKVNNNGIIDLEDLREKLTVSKSEKKLVSAIMANNETGIIQPIKKITEIVHQYGAKIHSDCVQSAGKIDINLLDLDADFISISAHKFGGPVGAAALIGKMSTPLRAQIIGGGQERGMRAGTENILAIAGFGEAAILAKKGLKERSSRMAELRLKLENGLLASDSSIEIVGKNLDRLPNTSLIINPRYKAETQLIALDLKGVAISSGSACSSGRVSESHVLEAMGYSKEKMASALRISIGWNTEEQEIEKFLEIYNEINS